MVAHAQLHPVAAREAHILAHYPLVRAIAGRWTKRLGPSQEMEDLVNLGVLGLIDAVDRFDPARDKTFRAYAATRINGSIIDGLRARDWAPHSVRRNRSRVDDARRTLARALGRPPRRDEIAEALGCTMARYGALERKIQDRPMISASRGDRDPLIERLPAPAPASDLETRQLQEMAAAIIECLPRRERDVLRLRYLEGCTQQEVSERMSLSASRVSQLHRRGLERARLRAHQQLEVRHV
jgi:RNA polymerase sigma factor for flagellar operon FliA